MSLSNQQTLLYQHQIIKTFATYDIKFDIYNSRGSNLYGLCVSGFMIGRPIRPLSQIYGNDRTTIPIDNKYDSNAATYAGGAYNRQQYLYCLCHIKLLECCPVIAESVFGSNIVIVTYSHVYLFLASFPVYV